MILQLLGLDKISDNLSFDAIYLLTFVALFYPVVFLVAPAGREWIEWRVYEYRSKPSGLQSIGQYQVKPNGASDGGDPVTGGSALPGSGFKIHGLVVYPIKSCGYIKVGRAPVVREGLLFDRLFCFAEQVTSNEMSVTSPPVSWKFVTQRNLPRMANIKVEIWLPCPYEEASHESEGLLLLRIPTSSNSRPPWLVKLPLAPPAQHALESVNIWRDTPSALKLVSTEHQSSPAWIKYLRNYLGIAKHLGFFYLPQDHLRKVYRNAPRIDEHGWQPRVGFGDSYPLHIINLGSVRALEDVIKQNNTKYNGEGDSTLTLISGYGLNPIAFRPNVITKGSPAYAEDYWKRINIGQWQYIVTSRTARCPMPNVDQDTGERNRREPLRTMTKTRCIDEGAAGLACFGMMMVPVSERSVIHVGMSVEVLETGDHHYIYQ